MQRNKSNNTTNIGKITYRSDNISNENERINRKKTILLLRKCIRICPKEVVSKLLKTEFVEKVAKITKKSVKTVRCWIAGTQKPDALAQSVLEKEFKVPAKYLFPEAS